MRWPGERNLKRLARLRRIVALLIVTFAVDVVVELANPFGMVGAVKERAADTLQLVASSFSYPKSGQDAVTVVLIDQQYFEAVKGPGARPVWPMPVNALLMGVVGRVLDAKPKALFIDIAFPDAPREIADGEPTTRAGALKALGNGLASLDPAIPIFLGDDLAPGPDLDGERARCGIDFLPSDAVRASSVLADPLVRQLFQERVSTGVEVVDASWPGASSAYQLAPALTGARGTCLNLLQQQRGYVASPALALFSAYMRGCRPGRGDGICGNSHAKALARAANAQARPEAPDVHGLRRYTLREPAQGAVALRWGVALSPKRQELVRASARSDACFDQLDASPWASVKNYFIRMLAPVQRRYGEPTQRRCVYIDTISAGQLVGAPHPASAGPNIGRTFLTGRVVLLGVDLPQSADRFHSPINGDVPGVYMHAVAVENLLSLGDRYPSAESGWGPRLLTIALAVLLALGMAFVWDWLCDHLSRRWRAWGRHLLAPLAYAAIMFVLGPALICALWPLNLPLTEIALPLIVLHFILFAGMAHNWEKGLSDALGGGSAKTAQAESHAREPAQE